MPVYPIIGPEEVIVLIFNLLQLCGCSVIVRFRTLEGPDPVKKMAGRAGHLLD